MVRFTMCCVTFLLRLSNLSLAPKSMYTKLFLLSLSFACYEVLLAALTPSDTNNIHFITGIKKKALDVFHVTFDRQNVQVAFCVSQRSPKLWNNCLH